ncbi:hypothetical protein [Salinivirga cyanobacteriivorans]|uniref:hypothetical protein n=1 Tax=Salinivirga cyanobacteriivorans TaxID=1307839 RepID=UPI0012FD5529|nr:hypothetical protein [Salinivirga cyanobacteriivorans]
MDNPIDSLEQINDSTWIVYNGGPVDTAMVAVGGATYISDGAGTEVVVTEDDHFNVGGDGEGGSGGGADHDPVQDMIACDRPIEFVPHSMSKYGMDAYRDPPVTGYQTLTTGTQVTGIGWKAMSTDETGMLRVQVNDSDADELNFQYQSGGTGVSADGDATSGYTLSLQAPPGNEDILLAVCNRDTTTGEASIAGGIGVAAYERFALELKVVPVGHELNYTQEQLEEALNDIYGQAVVSWDVEYLPALDINYWDENGDGLIERPNTDYSNEMRAVWESFLASMQYDPVQQGQAYLFVIPGITEGGDVRGYMPIKSRYGFVTADATTRDVAHELGHGVFNLRHTFSEENSFTLPQGETDNLMDYSTGTELWKYQWDFIHNPEGGWHIFEDVEEGEMASPELSVESVNDNFAPGYIDLNVELYLSHRSLSNEPGWANIVVHVSEYENPENEYYLGYVPLPEDQSEDINVDFTWDGVMNREGYENELLPAENSPFSVKVTYGSAVVAEAIIEASIDPDLEIWNDNPDFHDDVDGGFSVYSSLCDLAIENGYFDEDDGGIIEFLENHNVENTSVQFLGYTVTGVMEEYAQVLARADTILKSNPNYSTWCDGKYSGTINGLRMRKVTSSTTSLSLHSLGAAIDMRVQQNPFITGGEVDNYQTGKYVKFVKYICDFDITSPKANASLIIDKSKEFLEKFYGLNFNPDSLNETRLTEIFDKYLLIYNYGNTSLPSIEALAQITSGSIIISNFEPIKDDITLFLESHRATVVFDEDSKNGITKLISHFNTQQTDTIPMLNDPDVAAFFAERLKFDNFLTEASFSSCMDLRNYLKVTKPYENQLLIDGFCDIDLAVYNAINTAHKEKFGETMVIEWGGLYNDLIDPMHFNINKDIIKGFSNP